MNTNRAANCNGSPHCVAAFTPGLDFWRSRNPAPRTPPITKTALVLTIGIDDAVGESKGPYFGACRAKILQGSNGRARR